MVTQTYDALNKAFKSTCRILLKEEIGELSDFEPYLNEYTLPYSTWKSFLSGKEVITTQSYPEGAKIISQDEMDQLEFKPVDVNRIKDIDSLLEAVSENIVYCGNRQFGKNENVEKSDNVVNCHNVSNVQSVFHSKYCAYTALSRECEHCFGLYAHPFARFAIRCVWGLDITRCFETYYCNKSSDCTFCYNTSGCSNALFSFNLRGSRYVIGNVELPKEKYTKLKDKLMAEVVEELKEKKRFPSLIGLVKEHGELGEGVPEYRETAEQREEKAKGIRLAFGTASKILLGKDLGSILPYEKWLLKNSVPVKPVKGAMGKETYIVEQVPAIKDVPKERFVGGDEALRLGKANKAELKENFGEFMKEVAEIAYFTHEMKLGQSTGIVDTPISYSSVDIYRVFDTTNSKHSGCTFTAIESEYVFGGKYRILHSKMCINCYESTSLHNCLEVDSSYSTSNSLFCHNCENVSDGIFCFNVKGKKYAVGNTEVGRDEYMRVKKILVDYLVKELEEKGDMDLSILSVK